MGVLAVARAFTFWKRIGWKGSETTNSTDVINEMKWWSRNLRVEAAFEYGIEYIPCVVVGH